MERKKGFWGYMNSAADLVADFSYLPFSGLFLGAGAYVVNTTDLDELGYGIMAASLAEVVFGTCRLIHDRRDDRRRDIEAEKLRKSMECSREDMRKMTEEMRKMIENELRRIGKRVHFSDDAMEEAKAATGDAEEAMEILKGIAPHTPNSSVEIDAGAVRKYIDKLRKNGEL